MGANGTGGRRERTIDFRAQGDMHAVRADVNQHGLALPPLDLINHITFMRACDIAATVFLTVVGLAVVQGLAERGALLSHAITALLT